jgi:hypothetical protein
MPFEPRHGRCDHCPEAIRASFIAGGVALSTYVEIDVSEMIAAITDFQGDEGMAPIRYRRFHARDDRFLGVTKASTAKSAALLRIGDAQMSNPSSI